MPKVDQELNNEENSDRRFKKTLGTLRKGLSSLKKTQGLSLSFHKEIETIEVTMELCEKAMRTLSTEYVEYLESFKYETQPLVALKALDRSEEIWQREAEILRENKKKLDEEEFLLRMRKQAMRVFDLKLLELTSQRKKKPDQEEIALCLGILGASDQAFEELGYPKGSKERRNLVELVKAFQ